MAEALSYDDESEDSEDNIFSDEEIKQYFRVDLMYMERVKEWPNKTILHYVLTVNNLKTHTSFSNKLFNSSKKHAEENLLEDLKEIFDGLEKNPLEELEGAFKALSLTKKNKVMKMELEITMNYSPCKECADNIKSYINEIEKDFDIHVIIRFGSFYLLYPKDDKNKHIEGLAQLQNAEIILYLVWDLNWLKKRIKKLEIGSKKERKKRKKKDRKYMELVSKKALKLLKKTRNSLHKNVASKTAKSSETT
ncbi:hypothetical protein CHS0354_036304 [Potamilus streckersoni]|uniref:Activation-induced cytidine deaminase AID domain-containing protein n=1 Tax=Potamilus streckersoni TaxID=2493646 RepID=A0AAE0T835_9BIVA|nr:hypothetical protein CHS0354_036304 [Potamilus streckersoni]